MPAILFGNIEVTFRGPNHKQVTFTHRLNQAYVLDAVHKAVLEASELLGENWQLVGVRTTEDEI